MNSNPATDRNGMTVLHCTLEGFDVNEVWQFSFESPRELVRFLRKLGKGQLKRAKIARIVLIAEAVY